MVKKLFYSIMCMSACLIIFGMSARADGFDAAYYAAKYPDVVNELGTDPQTLYNHYLTFGIKEGRFQNAVEEYEAYNNPSVQVVETPSSDEPTYQTYVDINIESQTVTYFENGELKLQSPCVTGNTSLGRGTPCGIYSITTQVPGKFLTGPTWNVWVDRWMPFNGNIGIHDALWRDSFGGTIYQTNGSHGCVNLPHDAAVSLYDMAKVGTTVVVH